MKMQKFLLKVQNIQQVGTYTLVLTNLS
ncbi:protein of unknown function [Ruminococcaceae bacterium BL-6]|nr:protein of unknown function [Ruminococcaceae bacterium BL-6]